jgi:hypothetical protein
MFQTGKLKNQIINIKCHIVNEEVAYLLTYLLRGTTALTGTSRR